MFFKRTKIRSGKTQGAFAAALICFYMTALSVSAAEGEIAAVTNDENSIYCYVKGISGITEGKAQIGNIVCDDLAMGDLMSVDTPLRTVILLDNSASIKRSKRTDIQKILDGLIEQRLEGESFKVGVFNDSITWLCDYSADYEAVQESIDAITYNNQTTYFGDCLYQVLSEINEADFKEYTRVIMISDGADNQKLGYTNLEVSSYVKESGIPVYTIGTPGDNEALETMFAFSRVSNAGWYLLDGSRDVAEILEELETDHNMICIRLTPDESLLDGGQKQIRLVLQTAGGEAVVTTFANMPLGEGRKLAGDDPTEESTEKSAEKSAGSDRGDGEERSSSESNSNTGGPKHTITIESPDSPGSVRDGLTMKDIIAVMIVLAVAVLAAGVLFLLIRFISKRSAAKNAAIEKSQKEVDRVKGSRGFSADTDITLPVNDGMNGFNVTNMSNASNFQDPFYAHSGETVMLFGQDQGNLYVQTYLVLKDVERPASMFKVAINSVVRIGRKNADIVIDYDRYISAGQCEIIRRGELLYIRDIGSTNGTFYDGMRVYDQEVPIVSGGTVQMGRSRFVITIVQE